jgi:PhnB protein
MSMRASRRQSPPAASWCGPVANQFYGDRSGGVDDPFGYHWYLATHVEDVPPEEMKKRMAKMMESASA